jgi:anti-sigma factor RsiW
VGQNGFTIMNAHPKGEEISAYVDGMLDLTGMRGVARHLRECDPCRNDFEAILETKALMRHVPQPASPPAEFWTNAFRTIRVQERESQLQNAPLAERLGTAWTLAQRRWASGVMAAALLGVGLMFNQVGGPSPSVTPSTRAAEPADVLDIASLVHAHTQSVALQPLADPDRQAMISADNESSADTSSMEASVNADSSL